jgi:hypothetical protein
VNPTACKNPYSPPSANDSLNLKRGHADNDQYEQQADEEGTSLADLVLLLNC